MPALPASPATLTSIRMRSPGRAARGGARARAAPTRRRPSGSAARAGRSARTLRLCSAPMKSHVEQRAVGADLRCEVLGAVLPDQPHARLGEHGADPAAATYLVAASTSTAPRPGAARPDGRGRGDLPRMRSRFVAHPARRRRPAISSTMRPPACRPARRAFAAVGEEAPVADRARRHVVHPLHAAPPAAARRAIARRSILRAARGARAPSASCTSGRPRSSRRPRTGRSRPRAAPPRPARAAARTPSSSTPAASPRQPAWTIATAPSPPSATGRQSALSTIAPTPASAVACPSARPPRARRRTGPRARSHARRRSLPCT